MLGGPYVWLVIGLALIGAGFTGGWKAQAGRVERAQKGRMNAEAGQALAEAALSQAQAIGEAQAKAATGAKAEADALRKAGLKTITKWRTAPTPIGPTCEDAMKFLSDEIKAEQAIGGAP